MLRMVYFVFMDTNLTHRLFFHCVQYRLMKVVIDVGDRRI